MQEMCEWLHTCLERLPLLRVPFDPAAFPHNGIFFLYEEGEAQSHGKRLPRVVFIGSHRGAGNLWNRVNEHFLQGRKSDDFNRNQRKPSDRSILRKNLGRALLNQNRDPYLEIWNISFTERENRERFGERRDIGKERKLEREITKFLQERFSLRFVILDEVGNREGQDSLKARLIGTVAQCPTCCPSLKWLGRHSPEERIVASGLWQTQFLTAAPLDGTTKEIFEKAVKNTVEKAKRGT
jgi:hypothetical protein